MKIELQRVRYIPKELKPGVLYVSEEFGAASHLCACGCGSKIRTPLGPTEWALEEAEGLPTLRPSIGNWQQACQSHYWIYRGKLYGLISGRLSKSLLAANAKMSADVFTMM